MSAYFIPLEKELIKTHVPKLFREDAQYFSIVKDGKNTGIYGIIDRDFGNAEVFMTIFKEYRFKILNKKTLDLVINTPFDFGYNQVWSWTRLASWVRLLQRIKNVELTAPPLWDLADDTKIWFRKGM